MSERRNPLVLIMAIISYAPRLAAKLLRYYIMGFCEPSDEQSVDPQIWRILRHGHSGNLESKTQSMSTRRS